MVRRKLYTLDILRTLGGGVGVVTWGILNEPAHDKTYNKICATSEDSDQPAHPRSHISLTDRICLLLPPGLFKEE